MKRSCRGALSDRPGAIGLLRRACELRRRSRVRRDKSRWAPCVTAAVTSHKLIASVIPDQPEAKSSTKPPFPKRTHFSASLSTDPSRVETDRSFVFVALEVIFCRCNGHFRLARRSLRCACSVSTIHQQNLRNMCPRFLFTGGKFSETPSSFRRTPWCRTYPSGRTEFSRHRVAVDRCLYG
jgi:hypothetical protein